MRTRKLFLGIDLSTTGAKALLMDDAGNVVSSATTDLTLSTPKPLWSEQSPTEWWHATVSSIRRVLAEADAGGADVQAVGLTGQMHGLVLLDEAGEPLRPAILWNDQRTGPQCEAITERLGFERLLALTGNPALAGFTAPKILWVREHEPDIYGKASQILLPKDYIRYRLTGEYATDKAGAAGTLLMDIKTRDWSDDVLKALDISPDLLPRTHEGPAVTGVVAEEAARLTGLQAGTPVVGGGGDQAAQAVGVGAVAPGIVALTLGTSGVVFAPTSEPIIENQGRLHAFCHAVPGQWHLMGAMLSAAGSLRWYRDTLAPGEGYDELLAPAADMPIGAEGLFFLPHLTGERTPHPDPLARAGFVGLTLRHTRAHMTRALLEGVAFGLADVMALVQEAGLGDIRQIRVSGGGARSPLWRQILADVLGRGLVTVNAAEGAAYGAALLAAVGAGRWASVPEACAETIKVVESTEPSAEAKAAYAEIRPLYRALYPALKAVFHGVAGIAQ